MVNSLAVGKAVPVLAKQLNIEIVAFYQSFTVPDFVSEAKIKLLKLQTRLSITLKLLQCTVIERDWCDSRWSVEYLLRPRVCNVNFPFINVERYAAHRDNSIDHEDAAKLSAQVTKSYQALKHPSR